MKVYVDELPKNCANCFFGYANNECEIDVDINLRKFDIGQKHPKCPLQSLTNYTQKVRKEVVEEIRFEIDNKKHLSGQTLLYDKVMGILDQIQEERK